eukprot:13735173-Alexandrium_andersonii.AAC.1
MGASWARPAEGLRCRACWHQPLAPSPRVAFAVPAGPPHAGWRGPGGGRCHTDSAGHHRSRPGSQLAP